MSPILLLVAAAEAACQLAQTPTPTGTHLDLVAVAEPLSCRRITLRAEGPAPTVTVRVGKRKVPRDHVRVAEGLVEIGLPELRPGENASVDVSLPGDHLEVLLGEPPAPESAAKETHVTWTVSLDARHPGWGFADPKLSSTHREVATVSPDHLRVSDEPGAPPQGILHLDPGSFTLHIPGAHTIGWGSPGVTVTRIADGLRFDAPTGGEARWMVESVLGAQVIPDTHTYVEGLDWRFSQASLPEPAVPMAYATMADPLKLAQSLYGEVQGLVEGWLPGPDVLHPRQLNRAWRSGWATPVERALILDRMLKQERLTSAWALTGRAPEPLTLTGYDHMLVAVQLPEREVLLDPACAACAFDEVSPGVAGKPAIGAARVVPLSPGRLERSLQLNGTQFSVTVKATGAAALWLREATWGVTDSRRDTLLGELLGMEGAQIVTVTGLPERGADVAVTLTSDRPPRPVFTDEPPWIGGWTDL